MDTTRHLPVPLPAHSLAVLPEEPRGVRLWLDQNHPTSLAELAFIALGHTALGFIVGVAFFSYLESLPLPQ